MKKIVVDAMGGDYAPQAIVEGVNQALADFLDIEVQLYGAADATSKYFWFRDGTKMGETTG